MEDVRDLKALQLDALREVANIGAGHAATALSQLTHRRIMISVPEINIARLEEVPGLIGDPQIVAGQATFRQWEDNRLPNGWVGSAVVVADRPVVVLANLESDVFKGDPVMVYSGISLE